MIRLSLCMIVRDEAAMLPDFLASVHGLWDELIAVDTGSTDETRALLEAAGARVLSRPWDHDFAAARNASLDPAGGQWILFLDADERPSASLREQIAALVDDSAAGAATIRMRNRLPHGEVRESDLLRLWRRDPQIRFSHRIHEEAGTAVAASLKRRGLRLVNLTGCCEHLGYVREVAESRTKKDRDRALLQACIDDDPRDWYSWYKLLELARFWQDYDLWHTTATRLAPLLEGPFPGALSTAPWAGDFVALAAQGLFDEPAKRLTWLARREDAVAGSPAFHLLRATTHEELGDIEAARRDFERCLVLPAGSLPMLTGLRPLVGLCRLAARRGDLKQALDLARQAVAHNPRDLEALLAAVHFSWLDGGRAALDAFTAQHRRLYGDSEELALTLGEHALQAGEWTAAAEHLRPLAGRPARGKAALLLGQALLAGGQVEQARDLCRELMADLPVAGMGYLTCCLALGEAADFSVDISQEEADTALKEWLRVLWRSGRTSLMSAVVDNMALVGGVFPWLPVFLTEETERLRRQVQSSTP
jgi:tetratricopeptide (TPR) repeat protein